jgi:hypothetical protein
VAWQQAQKILENGKPPFPGEGGFPFLRLKHDQRELGPQFFAK